jgi:hypothetical protein
MHGHHECRKIENAENEEMKVVLTKNTNLRKEIENRKSNQQDVYTSAPGLLI